MEIWHVLNSMVSKYEAIPWLFEQNLGIEMQVSKILLCQWFALDYSTLSPTIQSRGSWDYWKQVIILTLNLQNLVFNKN